MLHRLEQGGKHGWYNFVQEIEEVLTAMYKISSTVVDAGKRARVKWLAELDFGLVDTF